MLYAFGLAGRTGGVQHEQGVFRTHGYRRALAALARQRLGESPVAPGHHIARGCGALVDEHGLDRLTAAHAQTFVNDGLERQLLAAAHLVVGRDHGHRTGVDDALLQRLGREPAEHHAVGRADTRASLHRNHAFERHRHVDQHPVALADTVGLERVRELAHTRKKLAVAGLRHRAVIGLENDRGLVFHRRANVFVQAVGAGVELPIVKPLVERRIRLVQRTRERLAPDHVVTRQTGPKSFKIFFGLGTQGPISVHAGNAGRFYHFRAGRKNTVFNQD